MLFHTSVLLFFCLVLVFHIPNIECKRKRDKDGEGEENGPKQESNYYEIYEAIDTLTALTPHRTFYELLGVDSSADSDEISRSFRKASMQYHPDKLRQQGKLDETNERLSKLIQFVGSLLRTEKGRKEYDWVLNEAPAWHRQTVYVMKRLVPTSKLSVKQVIIISVIFSIGIQLMGQWISYLTAWYMIMSSRWALKGMGEKEVRKIRKRMTEQAVSSSNTSSYNTVLMADSKPPAIPNPFNLWPVQVPLFFVKLIFCRSECQKIKKG